MRNTTLLSTDSLVGNPVRNTAGEDLGSIKELMLDTRTGEIAYAVLSFGGFMGFGDKYFAVPYQLLRLDTTNKCFVFNIEKERLEDAPGFDKDDWPDAANFDFVNEVYAFYGYDPFYGESYDMRVRNPITAYAPEA